MGNLEFIVFTCTIIGAINALLGIICTFRKLFRLKKTYILPC